MASGTTAKKNNSSRSAQDQRLRALKSASSHPLRFQILTYFKENKSGSPNEISKTLGEPLGNVSYHVGALRDDELIVLQETVPRRGALEHYYEMTALGKEALGVVTKWMK